jgi:uncharacterized protein YndB with AHSA1/START domain
MGEGRVDAQVTIHAPLEKVFERFADHEGMSSWPGVGSCRLVREGTPKNGLGAMRRVKVGGLTIDEEVVHYDPPKGFDYAVRRGLPVSYHLGQVRFAEQGDAVQVTWTVRMRSKWPLAAQIAAGALRRALPGALRYLKAGLEAP